MGCLASQAWPPLLINQTGGRDSDLSIGSPHNIHAWVGMPRARSHSAGLSGRGIRGKGTGQPLASGGHVPPRCRGPPITAAAHLPARHAWARLRKAEPGCHVDESRGRAVTWTARRGHAPHARPRPGPSAHSVQGGSARAGRIWGPGQTRTGARRWPARAPAGDGRDPEIGRHSGDGPGQRGFAPGVWRLLTRRRTGTRPARGRAPRGN
jgi:hypothetical protein